MKQKFKRGGVLTLVLILILSISFCGVKFIKHEKSQQDRIASLEDRVTSIEDRIAGLEDRITS